MLVVNLFAPPGSGKSTMAAHIFAKLKQANINCELVTEFAKDLTWENRQNTLENQLYVFAEQHHRVNRLKKQVDVVITDSPFNDRFDEKISLILKETAQNIKQRKEYTMCEYCQNQLEKDIYNYKDDVDSHYIYVYDNLLCIELNFDYSKSFAKHVEINYCPMCGRKL